MRWSTRGEGSICRALPVVLGESYSFPVVVVEQPWRGPLAPVVQNVGHFPYSSVNHAALSSVNYFSLLTTIRFPSYPPRHSGVSCASSRQLRCAPARPRGLVDRRREPGDDVGAPIVSGAGSM